MIVYLARDIPAFVMYCVNGESGSSLLIESTDSMIYHRSGFDCEILLIANCEFFLNSQSKESQEKEYSINNILPAWQFAIIKIAI